MNSIIRLLPSILRLSNFNEELCESASFVAWRVAAGHSIAKITIPKRLIKKTLLVIVMDIPWKRELEGMSTQLLFQINTILGSPLVTGFDFYIDPSEITAKHLNKNEQQEKEIEIDEKIIKAAEKIKDKNLQEQFVKTASKYLSAQEERQKKLVETQNLINELYSETN
jgi:hypothetical protein